MANTDPEAIERDIERTRAELARTVDAIAERVSPKRVAERNVAKVKAQASQAVASLGELVGGSKRADGDLEVWEDEYPARDLAPLLISVGAVVVLGAVIVLWRRRK